MPVTKSAKKALKQNKKRRVFNLRRSQKMKSLIKEIRTLITLKKKEEAQNLLPQVFQAIDKAFKRGVIKKNTAARKKSRISKAINQVK